MNDDKLAQALRAGLEAAQELLAIKREALGDDYTKTRGYWEAERELSAALAEHEAEKQAGPVAGWKLVPVEPTKEMADAAINEADRQETHWRYDGKAFWAAILAAAPSAPPRRSESDKEGAERYTIDEITEAVLYAEIPDGQFESMLISLEAARAKKEQP